MREAKKGIMLDVEAPGNTKVTSSERLKRHRTNASGVIQGEVHKGQHTKEQGLLEPLSR